jgi:DNA polymerase-4
VLHVDLDQFIAAVEVLRRPELRGRPLVVGGDGDPAKRGVVSTASYEARAHGVHSGLPLRTAARRCPEAVFLPVDREVYEAASAQVMDTLREFDAVVEVMGWDEAFWGRDRRSGGTGPPGRRARPRQHALDCSGRDRPEQAAGEAGHRLRKWRDLPADPGQLVRRTRRPAADALWGLAPRRRASWPR